MRSCCIDITNAKIKAGFIESESTTLLSPIDQSCCCIHTPKMIEMMEMSSLVNIDIIEKEKIEDKKYNHQPNQDKLVNPSDLLPLHVEIDWKTADWDTHKDKVESNFFKLGSPLSNTIRYHSILYK